MVFIKLFRSSWPTGLWLKYSTFPSLRCNPSPLRVKLSNHHTAKCQFGPVVRRHAGKQTDAGLIPLWLSFSFKSCGSWTLSDWDFVPPQGISKWLAELPVFGSRSHPGGDSVMLGTVYSPPPPPQTTGTSIPTRGSLQTTQLSIWQV